MAWYSGTHTVSAGSLLTILDTYLVANSCWSVYDANAGTNCKVYRNQDSDNNIDYFVKVDDNYSDHAIIELWEYWDSGTHTGSGLSITMINNYVVQLWRHTGSWGLAVSDHRFIFVNYPKFQGFYVGMPLRFDTTLNCPILIATSSSSWYNPLGYTNSGSNGQWATMQCENGTFSILQSLYYNFNDRHPKTCAGTYIVYDSPIYSIDTKKLLGKLEGVAHYYLCNSQASGMTNGDIIQVGGIEWVLLGGATSAKYWCAVKKT